jgi:prepilin-type N-terminal cleavage/methylation domain-containing protein
MQRISPSKKKPAAGDSRTAGYSLIEMLIVIAIIAITSAIALPRAAGALDQVISHTVFFEFQRQVSALRAEAFRDEKLISIVTPDAVTTPSDDQIERVALALRSGWTYELSGPFLISPGASCSNLDVDLVNQKRSIIHLESRGHDCRFIRTR